MAASSSAKHILFGSHRIPLSHVFFESEYSYGIVNLKPILPGHVMIIPKRVAPRFADLSKEEAADLSLSAWTVGPKLERKYSAAALNIAMQDGKTAGQSVPHVHVHLLPRKADDFARNDEVYERLERWDGAQVWACKWCGRWEGDGVEVRARGGEGGEVTAGGEVVADPHGGEDRGKMEDIFDDAKRCIRTEEEMAKEATDLRELFGAENPVSAL